MVAEAEIVHEDGGEDAHGDAGGLIESVVSLPHFFSYSFPPSRKFSLCLYAEGG